jgi:hypothetical protein
MNGENTEAMREVMPMVAMAFYSSTLSLDSAGHAITSLFGVFTRLDFNQRDRGENLACALQTSMYEGIRQGLQLFSAHGEGDLAGDARLLQSVFKGFEGSCRDGDDSSDIKFVGMLNGDFQPPCDTPVFEYGCRVRAAVLHATHRVRRQNGCLASQSELAKVRENLVDADTGGKQYRSGRVCTTTDKIC